MLSSYFIFYDTGELGSLGGDSYPPKSTPHTFMLYFGGCGAEEMAHLTEQPHMSCLISVVHGSSQFCFVLFFETGSH